jgi:hypothetical protein
MSKRQASTEDSSFEIPSDDHHKAIGEQGGVATQAAPTIDHDGPLEKDRTALPDSAVERVDQARSQDGEACSTPLDILDIQNAVEFPSLSTSSKVSNLSKRERKQKTAEMLQSESSTRSWECDAMSVSPATPSDIRPSSSERANLTPAYVTAASGGPYRSDTGTQTGSSTQSSECDAMSVSSPATPSENRPSSSDRVNFAPAYAAAAPSRSDIELLVEIPVLLSTEPSASSSRKNVPTVFTVPPVKTASTTTLLFASEQSSGQATAQPPTDQPTAATLPRTPGCRQIDTQIVLKQPANTPISAKKSLNVDSPSFTPTQLQQGGKKHTFSSQTANAAVFTPKAVATSKLK